MDDILQEVSYAPVTTPTGRTQTDFRTDENNDALLDVATSGELFIPAELVLLRTTIENLLRQGGIEGDLLQDLIAQYKTGIMELAATTAQISREKIRVESRINELEIIIQRLQEENRTLRSQVTYLSSTLNMLRISIAGVIHDIKNMLTTIFASFELAKPRLEKNWVTSFNISQKRITKSLEFLMEVMMLQVRGKAKTEQVVVQNVIGDILKLIGEKASAKVLFWQDLSRDENKRPGIVSMNETFLFHSLFNILSNAVRIPTVTRVSVYTKDTDQGIEIHICDDGPGIERSDRDRVFNLFEQSTNSTSHGHYGVGLAFTRYLIEMSGGTIEIDPAESESIGTEFIIRFPVR